MFAKQRPGNILLLALLMLAAGLVGGLTIAVLVLGELRQATALDSGLVAYAQAESGLEQSLYNVRQDKICNSTGACSGSDSLASYSPCAFAATASSNPTCNRKILPATLLSVPYLDTNQNFQLDFSPITAGACTPPAATITINQWSRQNLTDQPALEISYIELRPGSNTFTVYRPGIGFIGLPYDCGAAINSLQCSAITLPFPFSTCDEQPGTQLYQVRVRALNAPVTDLSFNLSGASAGSNYLDIWSQGSLNGTTQTLKTTVPKNPPAYGFSDYVIFSEQDINK